MGTRTKSAYTAIWRVKPGSNPDASDAQTHRHTTPCPLFPLRVYSLSSQLMDGGGVEGGA